MSERVICPHCKHEYGSEDDQALNSTYSKGNFTCIFGCGQEFPAPQGGSNISKAIEVKQSSSQRLKVKYLSIQNISIAIGLISILMAIFLGNKVNAIGFGVGDIVFIGICLILLGSLFKIFKWLYKSKIFKWLSNMIGESLIIIGLILMIIALNMDTTHGNIHNIGLLNKKQNFVIVSSVIFIAGIIITALKRFIKRKKDE